MGEGGVKEGNEYMRHESGKEALGRSQVGRKGKEGLKKKFLSLNTVMKSNTMYANSKGFC